VVDFDESGAPAENPTTKSVTGVTVLCDVMSFKISDLHHDFP
jgi:hypothetical protein